MSLEGSAVEILSGLAAFRPVPSVGEWVLCLLLLRDGESDVRVCGDMCVSNFKSVVGLDCSSSEAAGSGGFLDKKEVEECNKQDEGCERVKHESRGKGQALSFCQRLIQLWLRSRLKQQILAKRGDLE